MTEFGWTTHPPARQLGSRAPATALHLTTIAALGHTNCGVAVTILYTWVTPERNPADREDWFGIHSPGGTSADGGLRGRLAARERPGTDIDVCG